MRPYNIQDLVSRERRRMRAILILICMLSASCSLSMKRDICIFESEGATYPLLLESALYYEEENKLYVAISFLRRGAEDMLDSSSWLCLYLIAERQGEHVHVQDGYFTMLMGPRPVVGVIDSVASMPVPSRDNGLMFSSVIEGSSRKYISTTPVMFNFTVHGVRIDQVHNADVLLDDKGGLFFVDPLIEVSGGKWPVSEALLSRLREESSPEYIFGELATKKRTRLSSPDKLFPDAPKARLLAIAASKGRLGEVERLVRDGVDVNARGESGVTPLFFSLENIDGFRKLLELGANPNLMFGTTHSVMHWIARFKDIQFLELALKYGGDPNLAHSELRFTPLYESIAIGKKEAMKLLLDAGADMEFKDAIGRTAVIQAADSYEFELAYILLIRGADYRVSYDGDNLADFVFKQKVPGQDSEKNIWKQKVLDWLAQHGLTHTSGSGQTN